MLLDDNGAGEKQYVRLVEGREPANAEMSKKS
jgi:hypothetical protein